MCSESDDDTALARLVVINSDVSGEEFSWLPKTAKVCDFYLKREDGLDKWELLVARVFVVGTIHFSAESHQDVRKIIGTVRPDVVMVELCQARAVLLDMDTQEVLAEATEASSISLIKTMVAKHGFARGILQATLLTVSAHFTRELGVVPGGEFRVALEESKKLSGCKFVLGDRPVDVTVLRGVANLTFWEKMKLVVHLIASLRLKITDEDIERMKDGDMIEEMLREVAGEFPSLMKALLAERDMCMAYVLRKIVCDQLNERFKPPGLENSDKLFNVVAVVGMGHLHGIVDNLPKDLNVSELMRVPPSRKSYVFKGLKMAFYGLLLYGSYRIGKRMYSVLF